MSARNAQPTTGLRTIVRAEWQRKQEEVALKRNKHIAITHMIAQKAAVTTKAHMR